jgi:hypothetical protein
VLIAFAEVKLGRAREAMVFKIVQWGETGVEINGVH